MGIFKKSSKWKRNHGEFRGIGEACTACELIMAYTADPVTINEKFDLTELVRSKGELFPFELLEENENVALDILADCYSTKKVCEYYGQWVSANKKAGDSNGKAYQA